MTFRTKLLLICSLTVTGSVALVTGAASLATRRVFEKISEGQRLALLNQFQYEMKLQAAQVRSAVERAATSDAVVRIAAEAGRPDPDFASFYNTAQSVAQIAGLDFIDITQRDLTILSSAHWPARFGYKSDWVPCSPCSSNAAFLVRIPMPDGSTSTALAAMQTANGVVIVGARKLDSAFLKSLGEAPGVRALLWLSPHEIVDAQGRVENPEYLKPAIEEALRGGQRSMRIGDDAFLAVPLRERGQTMGVLLAASSLRDQLSLERAILWIGLCVGGSGILLGVLLGWWTTEKITRPVDQLARSARAVAEGNWSTQVEIASKDEIGELAQAFNRMTAQLVEQRDRALQAERVAAWRELARRLAHELKNPLFPLQITIENLQRARGANPDDFEEVFHESTVTLLEEVSNLQTIIGRFSDFARMPLPRFECVDVNEVLRGLMKLYDRQLAGPANIQTTTELEAGELSAEADPEQLRRAFGNLVLNAIDAMKQGGTLTIRTKGTEEWVRIEVSDTGEGLTEEERQRLFTPYYTTKQYGTGLGLAIVQSVISDHHGKIAVESQPGKGATFVIDLPRKQPRKAT